MTFLMLGKYSAEAAKGISRERTDKATAVIKNLGGMAQSMFALLGGHDLALIIEFPGVEEAMKASVALSRLTGIAFVTAPAVPVEDFDKMTVATQ